MCGAVHTSAWRGIVRQFPRDQSTPASRTPAFLRSKATGGDESLSWPHRTSIDSGRLVNATVKSFFLGKLSIPGVQFQRSRTSVLPELQWRISPTTACRNRPRFHSIQKPKGRREASGGAIFIVALLPAAFFSAFFSATFFFAN